MADSSGKVIHCWSGPRCCSTALMYSFAQRADTKVLDEPLYASYLHRTGIIHPGQEEILATYDTDGDRVMERDVYAADSTTKAKPILYVKHIGKHKVGVRNSVFDRDTHVLLVREPAAVLRSWAKVQEPTMQELGYTALLEIISELRFRGKPILLVLSDELVREPEAMLQTLCSAVGITFERAMLSWSPGPKPYDGCWAPYWYAGTHKSTGFSGAVRDTSSSSALPLHLRPLYHEASALFASMRALALRPTSTQVPRTPGQILVEQHKEDVIHQSGRLSDTGRVSVAGSGPNAAGSGGAAAAAAAVPAATVAAAAAVAPKPVCATGTHSHAHDERNADVLVGMRDGVTGNFNLVWRPAAKVSVLDSGFMLGDGMWEGLRLHRGVIMKVSEHFDRLWEGSKAVDMALGVTREELQDMVYRTVDANGMSTASGVHIRLMVTRGLKPTPYQSPYITIGQPTIVILPEYKEPLPGALSQGITLFTCHVRRGSPDTQDPGWNSHSKLNCIAACIQAKKAGADEALMLDPAGFVCTCNSTNFFIVRKGEVWSATTKYLMPGITRATVLKLCAQNNIPARELDFSLTQVYGADEAFVTGTYAGVTPVSSVDGRVIGSDGTIGPVTQRLQQLLKATLEQEANTGRKAKP